MSSNYGYDANGWEREPFPARDEHATRPNRVVDPELRARLRAMEAHQVAVKANPTCELCRGGQGSLRPGPGHCRDHGKHCSAAPCW